MNTNDWMRRLMPHMISLIVFLVVTLAYFAPLMSGKQIQMGDITNWKGMSQEGREYKEATGKTPLWTNGAFSGMPAYQIAMDTNGNFLNKIGRTVLKILPKRADILIAMLVGFYILLVVLGVSPWLSTIGALCYTFATYNMLIIEAGHITKAFAMAFMAPTIAGVLLTYKGHLWKGAALTGFSFILQLGSNHPQISYYMLLTLIALGIAHFVQAIQKNELPYFIKSSALLVLIFLLGVGTSATRLMTTYEYGQESMRGGSALEAKSGDVGEGGLEYKYAYDGWSYGIAETFTLLVPRFMGGSNMEPHNNKEIKTIMRQSGYPTKTAPLYWGDIQFTGGPIYHGAIVCFLFLFGCIALSGPLKWWTLAATIMSIVLAWGNHIGLNEFLFNNFPMHDKFRVPSMTLIIAQLTMPLLGIYTLHQLFTGKIDPKRAKTALYISLGVLVAILLAFILFGGNMFSFKGLQQLPAPFIEERQRMLRMDSIRSLILILLSGGAIWAYMTGKVKEMIVIAVVGVLSFFDLAQVDWRYLNHDDFVSTKKAEKAFTESAADKSIKQDTDPHFRVYNLAKGIVSDGATSYHHKSIGGYHGAKLSRYQDLIENHLVRGKENEAVLNMLNTKYIIVPSQGGQLSAQRNPGARGNAWLVSDIKQVSGAQAEMDALKGLQPNQAIVDDRYSDYVAGLSKGNANDSIPIQLGTIKLTSYHPDKMEYESDATSESLAVFSEIHYTKGWKAYIDDAPVDHIRANYLLRALKVPAGKHKIRFEFAPASVKTGEMVSYACSAIMSLFLIGAIVQWWREEKEGVEIEAETKAEA